MFIPTAGNAPSSIALATVLAKKGGRDVRSVVVVVVVADVTTSPDMALLPVAESEGRQGCDRRKHKTSSNMNEKQDT